MSMSRTQKSAKNLIVGMLSQAITIVLSFVSRTVFLRFLSTEYLGINGLLSNVLTVLSFAELGIGEAMTYAMYKPAKENDRPMMGKLLGVYKKAYTAIAITVGIVGLILSFFINYIVSEPPDIPESMQVIFWMYIINNMASYLLAYKKSVLIAYQENYIITYATQVTSITQQLLQILLLCTTHQYYLYLLVSICCTFLNNVIVAVVVKKRYPWIDEYKNDRLPAEAAKDIFKNVKALSVSKIAGVVANGADNIIISKILGLSSVGLVSNYTMLMSTLSGVVWSGLSNISSSFGNFNVDSTVERRRDIFDELFLCSYWLYGFLTVGLVVLINPFITLWLGSEYVVSRAVSIVLILNIYIAGVNFPVYTYQTTLGMYKEMKLPYVMFGVCNIILSIILGQKLGLFGIYIATTISRLCTSEAAIGYYVYRYGLKLSPWKYVLKYGTALALLALNAFITDMIVSQITLSGVFGFAVKVIVCTLICNLIFLICFYRTQEFKHVKDRVLGLLKAKLRR
jgi:O-antigen/teichoic acid export membrane protein